MVTLNEYHLFGTYTMVILEQALGMVVVSSQNQKVPSHHMTVCDTPKKDKRRTK